VSALEQSTGAPGRGNALGPVPFTIKGRYRAFAVTSTSREAVVYAATDLVGGVPVALEVLNAELAADADFVAAVRAQAQRLAKPECQHPALVRIHECGATEAGEVFVALEPVAGRSLREILDEHGALDPQRALRLAIQIGEALETLHHSGIVHGELRPESVLLVKDDAGDETAKLVGLELTSARRTAVGLRRRDDSVLPYLASEQIEHAETTEAADVHALGLLIQELLTGQRPRGTDPRLREAGDLPAVIGRIVTKALETGPARRYASVSLMVNDMWTSQTEAQKAPSRPSAVPHAVNERRVGAGRRARSDVGMAAGLVAALVMLGVTGWVVHSDLLAGKFRSEAPKLPVAVTPVAPATLPPPPLPPPPPSASAVTVEPARVGAATPTAAPVDPAPPRSTGRDREPAASAAALPVAKPAPPPARDSEAAASPAGAARRIRRAEPRQAQNVPARSEQAPSDDDGAAIIDWLLKDGRPAD
jgi:serine/threonine protein kinase